VILSKQKGAFLDVPRASNVELYVAQCYCFDMDKQPENSNEELDDLSIDDAFICFRELVKRDVLHLIENFPDIAYRDWACQCYQSRDVFAGKFPTSKGRRELLQELRQAQRTIKKVAIELMRTDPTFELSFQEAINRKGFQ
jgi:hypothetical protein